jgi:NAD(P)-dependent dehydrogenase (short-subunit alcohol dehydrogenase family)
MKVAITGHTSGIGQGLYNYFQERGYSVQGFDQTNGFLLPDAESQVLEQIEHYDIFINNALPVASQISLLKQLWPKWKNSDKKIIVLGSMMSQMEHVLPDAKDYQQQKQELDRLCRHLRYEGKWDQPARCSLMILHPGFVTTTLIRDFGIPEKMCMSVVQVVNVVDYMLNSPLQFDSVTFRKK